MTDRVTEKQDWYEAWGDYEAMQEIKSEIINTTILKANATEVKVKK